MAKTLVGTRAELWFLLDWIGGAYNWRALSQQTPFPDGATAEMHDPAGGSYSDPGRALTAGELGAGVAADGSLLAFFNKLKAEAETRETVVAGQCICDGQVRLYVTWGAADSYVVTIRTFSYSSKRNDPENAKCWPPATSPTVAIPDGYTLTGPDLGSDASVGDIAHFIVNKVINPIKTAESIA